MTAGWFNWKEVLQLIGGIALVGLVQTGLLFPDTRDFIGTWIILTVFGGVYAVLGGVTTDRFERRRRSSTME